MAARNRCWCASHYEPLTPTRSRLHAGTWHGPHEGSGLAAGWARNSSSGTLSTSRCCRRWVRHNRSLDVFHGRGQPATTDRDGGWHDGSGSDETASGPIPARASRRRHRWQTRARPNAVAWHPGARQTGRPSSGCSGGGHNSLPPASHRASARKAGSSSRSSTATASSAASTAAQETCVAADPTSATRAVAVTGPARQAREGNRPALPLPAAVAGQDARRPGRLPEQVHQHEIAGRRLRHASAVLAAGAAPAAATPSGRPPPPPPGSRPADPADQRPHTPAAPGLPGRSRPRPRAPRNRARPSAPG